MTTTEFHTHSDRCWWHPEQAAWVCHTAAPVAEQPTAGQPMTEEPAAEEPLTDVRDMVVVHDALRREFRLASAAVLRVGPGDRRQAELVDDHLGLLGDLLHHHHAGEDAILWPVLRERAPATVLARFDVVEAQHAGIDDALARVDAARAKWRADPDVGTRDALATELQLVHQLLTEHLDLEEAVVLPLAAALLRQPEWDALGEAAVATMPKPALALTFGMFAYEGDPAVVGAMLHGAPAPVRVLLPRIAPRLYARRARRVHGVAAP